MLFSGGLDAVFVGVYGVGLFGGGRGFFVGFLGLCFGGLCFLWVFCVGVWWVGVVVWLCLFVGDVWFFGWYVFVGLGLVVGLLGGQLWIGGGCCWWCALGGGGCVVGLGVVWGVAVVCGGVCFGGGGRLPVVWWCLGGFVWCVSVRGVLWWLCLFLLGLLGAVYGLLGALFFWVCVCCCCRVRCGFLS